MAAIPTALPAPPAANETTATAPTTAKETVAPSNEEEETTTTTTTDTEVKGCNVKFAKGTKPPTEQTIAAEKQMVPFQTDNNPNNGMGNQMGSQPSNPFQHNCGNQWNHQNFNPFINGYQPMGGNMFNQPQMFNNPFKSPYGQWNCQQPMYMQGKENQVTKPKASFKDYKEEYVTLLMDHVKGGKEIDPGTTASLTALGNIFSVKSTTTTTNSNKEAWYQSKIPAIKAWSGYNPEILTMNNKLLKTICSSAHKNTKRDAVENHLFAALIKDDRYFERGICNKELIDTIIELKFKPDNLVANKHNKGLGIAAMFKQGAETVQKLKQQSERLKSGNMTVVDNDYIENM